MAATVASASAQQLNSWGGVAQEVAYGVPGEKFSFGLWGDMPYAKAGDAPKIAPLIQNMNGGGILFSAFLGDIKDGSSVCADDQFSDAYVRFNSFVAPMVYIPGDNEWTDCHRLNNGSYNGLERLDYLRKNMFSQPESFGQRKMLLDHQGPIGGKFSENSRWTYGDVVFVGLNIPGSNNNKVNTDDECLLLSARTLEDCAADNAEYAERDAANIAWLHDSFRLARARGSAGIMIIIQADPGFDIPETPLVNERTLPAFDGYTNFLDAVVAETQAFNGQVVLVHGDTHFFKVDRPLIDLNNVIQNFTRLETFGSPSIHWVKVDVDPRSQNVFTFNPVYVPGN